MNNKLLKDIDFIVELDKMKSILRQTSLINEERREDDAQHSWHISIMSVILGEYANEKIDLLKVIKMLLIHDLVEIYAGDTFCYDVEGNKDKFKREREAADKIYGILDRDKGEELKELWLEFEKGETREALFAIAMDRLQPMLNNYNNKGGTWKKFNISKEEIYKRISPVKEISDEIWTFVEYMIEDSEKKGFILR